MFYSDYSSSEEDISHHPSGSFYLEFDHEDDITPDMEKKNAANKILDDLVSQIRLYEDIFSWTSVCTDFEEFSSFLKVLKLSNSFLQLLYSHTEKQPFGINSLYENKLKLKHLLWSLFTGIAQKRCRVYDPCFMFLSPSTSDSESQKSHQYIQSRIRTALDYYLLYLNEKEKNRYKFGSFLDRFKLFAKITRLCPIRLYLLPLLHDHLMCNWNNSGDEYRQNEKENCCTKRLFVTIIIDRDGISYCRLRMQTVHSQFETSRLTRTHGEEFFIRVNFYHPLVQMDARARFSVKEAYDFGHYTPVDGPAQYVSTLMNIAIDLANIPNHDKSEIIKQLLNEQSNIERLNNPNSLHSAHWSDSSFDNISEQWSLSYALTLCYSNIFKYGFEVAGRHFDYLMTTSGGVHKNMHIFYGNDLNSTESAEVRMYGNDRKQSTIRKNLCESMFSEDDLAKLMTQPLKMSLRMGLWFTPSISMELRNVNVIITEDIGGHTDGCGCVSVDLAKQMTAHWIECRYYKNVVFTAQNVGPTQWNEKVEHDAEIEYDYNKNLLPEYYSAFQVRLDGIKGMFVVDHRLSDNTFEVSKSQIKFTLPNETLRYQSIEIVQCSQPMKPARLNFALITLLIGCAKNPIAMQEYIATLALDSEGEINQLLTCKKYAIKFAIEHNDIKSFNMIGMGCSLKQVFLAGYYQNYVRRFKIIVKQSRRLFGIADFWNILNEGEVYIAVSGISEEEILGKVLVTKEPCYHRGDLRKLTAVSNYKLWKLRLKDVIMFSCKGIRSESNKISGSDLDGDQYFVCWDKKIVNNAKHFIPGNFDDVLLMEKVFENDGTNSPPSEDEIQYIQQKPSPSFCATHRDARLRQDFSSGNDRGTNPVPFFTSSGWSNVGEDNSSSIDYDKLLYCAAERAIAPHGISVTNISINELFDMRMRFIDSLGNEWTSWQWQPIMNKFFRAINDTLDAAKTGKSGGSIDWTWLWHSKSIPKYPHFHPTKGKSECQYSRSALGYIYDTIGQFIQRISQTDNVLTLEEQIKLTSRSTNVIQRWDMLLKFLRTNHLPQTAMICFEKIHHNDYHVHVYATNRENRIFSERVTVPEYHQFLNTTNECPDTLYDIIYQLKFSFLLEYISSSFSISNDTRSQNIENHDPSLESVSSQLSVEDIMKWFDQLRPTTFLEEEAMYTMLWKIMIWKGINENSDSEIHGVYLCNGSNLNQIGMDVVENILKLYEDGQKFICVNEHLLEDYNQTGWIDGTCHVLTREKFQLVIESLRKSIEQKFWKDLGLPYPNQVLRNLSIMYQSGKSPYDEIYNLVERMIRICDELDYNTSTEDTMAHSRANINKTFSDLQELLGILICFPDIWNNQEHLVQIRDQLAELCVHYIGKYEKAAEQLGQLCRI